MNDDHSLLPCPCCGGRATIKSQWVTHGHGDNTPDAAIIVCACGLKTRAVDSYDARSFDDRAAIAAGIWNRRAPDPVTAP